MALYVEMANTERVRGPIGGTRLTEAYARNPLTNITIRETLPQEMLVGMVAKRRSPLSPRDSQINDLGCGVRYYNLAGSASA